MNDDFRSAFFSRYQQPLTLSESRATAKSLDYPNLAELPFGQSVRGEGAVLFLDIRGYTRLAMAFADEPEKTANLLEAVLGGAVDALHGFGAHINDFTGDGVMAVFGGEAGSLSEGEERAIYAVSHLMTQMSAVLRDELLNVGIDDPVQVAMGLVSGPLLWRRVGTDDASRVAAIGEVAPLAAKHSADTKAWETMIGGPIAARVPDKFLTPKDDLIRTYNKGEMRRKRWLLDTSGLWAQIDNPRDAAALLSVPASVAALTGKLDPTPRRSGSGQRRERSVG